MRMRRYYALLKIVIEGLIQKYPKSIIFQIEIFYISHYDDIASYKKILYNFTPKKKKKKRFEISK